MTQNPVAPEPTALHCLYCESPVDPVEGLVYVPIPVEDVRDLTQEAVDDVHILLDLARDKGWTLIVYCGPDCEKANSEELDGLIRLGLMPVSETEN